MSTVPPHRPAAAVPEPHSLQLEPFRAVRYAPDRVSDLGAVTSPPYDLIDMEEARRLASTHRHNVVRLIRPHEGTGEQRYIDARTTLRSWLAEGVFRAEESPALYVYEQVAGCGRQRGLLGGLRLSRPESGIVLPHEHTAPGPIADRLELMRATEANLEPIFLLYEGGGTASTIVDEAAATWEPICVATSNSGSAHRIWRITDPSLHDRIAADLRRRTALIADGHHRYATYLQLQEERHAAGLGNGPWDNGLAFLVDSAAYPPTLEAIHRVIPALSPRQALGQAAAAFTVTRIPGGHEDALQALGEASGHGPAFVVAGDGDHHLVSDPDPGSLERAMPADSSLTWRGLATSVLHTLLIPRVWQIPDDEQSVRAYHHDAAGACEAAVRAGGTAVLLHPLDVGQVFRLARGGEKVPRKSTSFGPKPRTGLVLRTFATE